MTFFRRFTASANHPSQTNGESLWSKHFTPPGIIMSDMHLCQSCNSTIENDVLTTASIFVSWHEASVIFIFSIQLMVEQWHPQLFHTWWIYPHISGYITGIGAIIHTLAPGKQPWIIWVNRSYRPTENWWYKQHNVFSEPPPSRLRLHWRILMSHNTILPHPSNFG